MRGQWNTENASVISADDAPEPTVAITAGDAPWWRRSDLATRACRNQPPRLVVLDLSAAPRVDMQSAHALADLASEIVAKRIRFQAVEPRSSVPDRLRNEGVDGKLGG